MSKRTQTVKVTLNTIINKGKYRNAILEEHSKTAKIIDWDENPGTGEYHLLFTDGTAAAFRPSERYTFSNVRGLRDSSKFQLNKERK